MPKRDGPPAYRSNSGSTSPTQAGPQTWRPDRPNTDSVRSSATASGDRAQIGPRALASVIDVAMVAAAAGVVWLLASILGSAFESLRAVAFITLTPLLILLAFYNEIVLVHLNGQSIGRALAGVKVVDRDGFLVGLNAAAIRALARVVSFAAGYVGYLWMAWDAEGRTWHDIAADSRVLRVAANPGPKVGGPTWRWTKVAP